MQENQNEEQSTAANDYLYRFRSWDSNTYYSGVADANAWGKWEWIDEEKYGEILMYIRGGAHYQAEKLFYTVVDRESFDPVTWMKGQQEFMDRLITGL